MSEWKETLLVIHKKQNKTKTKQNKTTTTTKKNQNKNDDVLNLWIRKIGNVRWQWNEHKECFTSRLQKIQILLTNVTVYPGPSRITLTRELINSSMTFAINAWVGITLIDVWKWNNKQNNMW